MIEVIEERSRYHRYALMCGYSKDLIAYFRQVQEIYGWKNFSFSDEKWRFSDASIALLIQNRYKDTVIPDSIKKTMLAERLEQERKKEREQIAEEIKKKSDSAITVSGIRGELYPYQKVAVEFFMNNSGRAILADQMGCGKTLQVLAYIAHTRKQRTLVVCPASVKYSWESEVRKWTDLHPFVVSSKTDPKEIPYETNVVIINYDILKKHFQWLTKITWDSMVVDECHLIKNNTAARTKAVKFLARSIQSVLLLSGTPMLSRPIELFNALQMMDPSTWSNWYEYSRRYCDGKQTYWGWEAKGATNIEELEKRISRYFLRRTKDQVLPYLPKKVFVDIPVDLSSDIASEYRTANTNYVGYLKSVKKLDTQRVLNALMAERLTKVNVLRQITSKGKIDTAVELVRSIIDSGQKVLVFSSWNETIEQIAREFGDESVVLTGKVNAEDRRDIVDRFQNDQSVKVFCGGILSAGVGITLTAATAVVFLDYSWNPADHAQAIDRIHRPGATAESVTIYQLYARGTIDDMMRRVLLKKQGIFDTLIDHGESKGVPFSQVFMEEVLAELDEE